MWQRFSDNAKKAVFYAQQEAEKNSGHDVAPEHLLLGIIRDKETAAATVLVNLGVNVADLRDEVRRGLTPGMDRSNRIMTLTRDGKRIIDKAYAEAKRLGHRYIGTEHLLLGLVRERDTDAGHVLAKFGLVLNKTRLAVVNLPSSSFSEEVSWSKRFLNVLRGAKDSKVPPGP